LILFDFPANVSVWLWQLGHKRRKFSILQSFLFPFLWSSCKTNFLLFHKGFNPHISHISNNIFSSINLIFNLLGLYVQFSTNIFSNGIFLWAFFKASVCFFLILRYSSSKRFLSSYIILSFNVLWLLPWFDNPKYFNISVKVFELLTKSINSSLGISQIQLVFNRLLSIMIPLFPIYYHKFPIMSIPFYIIFTLFLFLNRIK